MAPADDLLNRETDRRGFVKVAAGVAVGGAALTLPFVLNPNVKWGRMDTVRYYVGAKRTGGPAPNGVPILPVTVTSDGNLAASPGMRVGSFTHSIEWHKYCSHQGAPGLRADYAGDDLLRYDEAPGKVAKAEAEGITPWWKDLQGKVARPEHFTTVFAGAPVVWRSEGQQDTNLLTAILMRVDPAQMSLGATPPAVMSSGFLAYDAACTHFCCSAGYQVSSLASSASAWDKIYCTCHGAVFDPRDLHTYPMPPGGG